MITMALLAAGSSFIKGRLHEGPGGEHARAQEVHPAPRKLRLFDTQASILGKRGDVLGQKETLTEALQYAKRLPKSHGPAARVAALEDRLAALER